MGNQAFKIKLGHAIAYARHHHAGQQRQDGEPYIHHCMRVAERVACNGGTPEAVLAAILHDTIEDTATTHTDLAWRFGEQVADMVVALTCPKHKGTRAQRKAAYRAQVAKAGEQVALIKLADMVDNAKNMAQNLCPKFLPVYVAEQMAMLGVLHPATPQAVCLKVKARQLMKKEA